jgi:hypothetical protein
VARRPHGCTPTVASPAPTHRRHGAWRCWLLLLLALTTLAALAPPGCLPPLAEGRAAASHAPMDSPRWTRWRLWAAWALALAGLAVVVTGAGAPPSPPPGAAPVARPPGWRWRLGLLGVALLRSAWPFPAPR